MSIVNTSRLPNQTHPLSTKNPSEQLIKNTDDDSQVRITLLRQIPKSYPHQHNFQKTNMNSSNTNNTLLSERRPSNLLELKQQRLLAAADRKKRIITRIISVVGLLIILLCAIIVTLTLKMAPKIDELVRTKTGAHQFIQLMSRMSTPVTTTIPIELSNSTTNSSSISKSSFQTRQKTFT